MTERREQNNQNPNLLGPAQEKRVDLTGKVRHILYDRGFMFVEGDDGYDYFSHWTGLNRSTKLFRHIREGDRVMFDIEDDPQQRGYRVCANSLRVMNGNES